MKTFAYYYVTGDSLCLRIVRETSRLAANKLFKMLQIKNGKKYTFKSAREVVAA